MRQEFLLIVIVALVAIFAIIILTKPYAVTSFQTENLEGKPTFIQNVNMNRTNVTNAWGDKVIIVGGELTD